jgi:hypothetical protein
MPDGRRPDDDALMRYWDEVVRDHPESSADLDPIVADAIRRVHALDDAPAPDRFFVAELWEELMHATTHAFPLVPGGHVAPNGTATSRPQAHGWSESITAGSQRRLGALVTAALLVLLLGSTFIVFGWPRHDRNDGAATVASPVVTEPGPETAIDPAECQVEPRSVDGILALWYPDRDAGTPVRTGSAREVRTSVPVPLGEPADAMTLEGISVTIREEIACVNAGDPLRSFALYSDDLMRSFGVGMESPIQDTRATLETPPTPLPVTQRIKLLAVTDVSVMADGRIGAFIVYDDPQLSLPTVRTLVAIFVEERGRWVFDEIVEFTVSE